ncbi:MAG: hypothetical protein DRG20_01830 [Deltaproteobacteria bacterium]|nr:MAG: hypothetical protein DRG20_01830 [Deltaproteobacteria bacterium]
MAVEDKEKAKALLEYFKSEYPNYNIEYKYVMHMRYEYRFIERGRILYRLALPLDFVDDLSVEEIKASLERQEWKRS